MRVVAPPMPCIPGFRVPTARNTDVADEKTADTLRKSSICSVVFAGFSRFGKEVPQREQHEMRQSF